jgi:Ca-activated chloride channel family protein
LSFQSPYWLLALLVIPILVVAYVWREHRRQQDASAWANPALIPNLVDRSPGIRRHLPVAILLVALAAMIFGVARPHATVTVRREEATVLLAIDTSRSMGATDVPPTRLRAAQTAANRFVDQVPKKYRIGVVSFATLAQVAVPPTDDRNLVHQAINSLHTGDGTAIGDAVMLSATLGHRQRADGVIPPSAVLMISDGSRDGGHTTPQAAATKARQLHVPVYAIMLGTPLGVVNHAIPGGYNEVIRVPPSAQTLQQIARISGGDFFTASNDTRLNAVYDKLRSRLGHKKQTREMTDAFAAGSLLLLLAAGALSALWFKRVP